MRVVVAGTFGPIHDGHRALFERALKAGGEGVIVGVTSDVFAEQTRKEPRPIPSFSERERAVTEELEALDEWGREVEVRRLDDRYGFAVSDPTIDAIVVSPESEDEVREIDRRRTVRGLDRLTTLVVPEVLAWDGRRISSTRIVRGEIDEHGHHLLDDEDDG